MANTFNNLSDTTSCLLICLIYHLIHTLYCVILYTSSKIICVKYSTKQHATPVLNMI